jgi:hypothetical protein
MYPSGQAQILFIETKQNKTKNQEKTLNAFKIYYTRFCKDMLF